MNTKSIFSFILFVTLSFFGLSVPLSGTYTINSSLPTGGTNYISFSSATADLIANGVSGPVTFLVKQGTYTEQISISSITGASSTNTIRFVADPTNTLPAEIAFNSATSAATNYVVQFNGTSFISFDSLTLSSSTGTSYGTVIDFIGLNSTISVTNCQLNGSRNLSGSTNFAVVNKNSTNTNIINNLIFENNSINGGSYGLYLYGRSSGRMANFSIKNNSIMNVTKGFVHAEYCSNLLIENNDCFDDSLSTQNLQGIYVSRADSAVDIKKNNLFVKSVAGYNYGIRVNYLFGSTTRYTTIENNMIAMKYATAGGQYGIRIENCIYQNVYHNSVRIDHTNPSHSVAIDISGIGGTTYGKTNVVNNIFVNNQGQKAFEYTNYGGTYFDSLNYNIYYSTGSGFKYESTTTGSLSAFQAASGQDANSLFGDPGFVSGKDLHLTGTLANNVGDNSIGVTTDIDGQTRPLFPLTTVDIGADEYSLTACPPLSAISSVEIRSDSATITWLPGPGDISWIIEYGAPGFSVGSGTSFSSSNDTTGISGLSASTCYDVYVKSVCASDTTAFIGPFNFCTPCASFSVPFSEDFTTMSATGPPTCWKESKGMLGLNSTLIEGYTAWTLDDFGNQTGLGTGSAKCELRYTNINEWLTSPIINIGNGSTPYQLEFDIAVTQRNSALAPVGGTIALDDKIVVLISTDYGATWSDTNILRQWDSTDIPSHLGELFTYNLTAAGYTGDIQISIYTQSTINNDGNEVFIDNFKIIPAPSCPSPSMLAYSSSTTNSITAQWVNGASDVSWLLEYGPVGFSPGSGTTLPISTSGTGTINGLNPSTLYDIYLTSICSATDTSRTIGPLKAQTQCAPISDFCEGFEANVDSSGIPPCWNAFINSTSGSFAYTKSNFGAAWAYQGDYALEMNSALDGSSLMILSTPELSNLSAGTHRINFWAKEQGSSGLSKLVVGTMSNPNNPASFNPIDTISLTTGYTNYIVSLTGYTGTDNHVSFLWQAQGTRDRVNIDEVCWEEDASCNKTTSAVILNPGLDSSNLNIGWNNDTAKASYLISYGSAGYNPATGTELGNLATTANFNSITGLTPVTEYCFWVKAICTNGDTSKWAGPYCASTGCPDSYSVTYTQDFTEYLPDCWEEKEGVLTATGTNFRTGTTSSWASRQFANQGSDFGANLQVYGSSVDEWLISPSINFGSDPNNWKIVEFDYALTDYLTTAPGAFSPDDSVVLVASYDNGTTWDTSGIIGLWDASTPVSPGTNRFVKVIKNKTGKVKFGFYGRSTTANNNNRFHLDNFVVRDTTPSTIGLNELSHTERFSVYPNPNQGEFQLRNKDKSGVFQVTLMDTKGRIVFSENTYFQSNESKKYMLNKVSKGIYIILIQDETNIEQYRVIVQ